MERWSVPLISCCLVATLASAPPARAEDLVLSLICVGEGSTAHSNGTSVRVKGKDGDAKYKYVALPTTYTTWHGEARVEINGNTGRIMLPREMWRHKEEKENWFSFKSVTVTDKEIVARTRLGMLTVLEVHIDRYTRKLRFEDVDPFSATCEKYEAPTERAF